MGLVDMLLMGVGLSMDAFAVSVCKGLQARKVNWRRAFVTAFFFGAFQAIMPLLGWLLGSTVQSYIEPVSGWVAFGLLGAIGGKMVWDAVRDDGSCAPDAPGRGRFLAELLMLAVATSIDAFVAGISFAMTDLNIWLAVTVIGLTTFVLSLVGTVVGNRFGSHFKKWATLAGGVCLVLLGAKILLEHLVG